MAQSKALHVGTSLEDLQIKSKLPDVQDKKFIYLLESAVKVLELAKKHQLEGDEEVAYIFYMKFFNLMMVLRGKKDYMEHKHLVREKLGDNGSFMQHMNRLESLGKSLQARYDEMKTTAKKADSFKQHTTTVTVTNGTQQNMSATELKTITSESLFEQLKLNKVLIMDCRSAADYALSHLHYQWAFNVPAECIQAGMSAGKVQDKLDAKSKALWSARAIKDQVVLMDWNCESADPPNNSTIGILLDILQNWDPDVAYRSPIKILQKGYEYFIMLYPTECTNPSVKAPQQNINNEDQIDDIEYPSISDITMKDEILERSYGNKSNNNEHSFGRKPTRSTSAYGTPPTVDRTSKSFAERKIKENQGSSIKDILKEQEQLILKTKATDAKLKEVSHEYEATGNDAEMQQIKYTMMQLENEANDYRIENERLRKQLDDFKKEAARRQTAESESQMIEAKIQELVKLQEQQENEFQQREQRLKYAREQKRQLKTSPYLQENDVPQVHRPLFDRSIKPKIQSPNDVILDVSNIVDRHRDFSPIPGATGPGLTGLKNLGNTCYMNSILQCLSNTPQLTDYCISDKYKQYISRSNKTKGQIVEEVAALIKALWNGSYRCVASKDLRYVIGQYQQMFNGCDQQDSHEFLTILMDWLHSDLQTIPTHQNIRGNITASEKAWLEFTNSKESVILHLFYGQIKSTVKCSKCNNESATYESFSNLSLELPSDNNFCQLEDCLDMYFSGERINGWNCPNCKQKREAVKKLDVSKLPPVLVIHLKRFYATNEGSRHTYKKNPTYVHFPLDELDMTPHIAKLESRSPSPKSYQLYAVSNHFGTMQSGHYTAFCKSEHYARWFKYDDITVTPLDSTQVVSSAAYILFYTWLPPI